MVISFRVVENLSSQPSSTRRPGHRTRSWSSWSSRPRCVGLIKEGNDDRRFNVEGEVMNSFCLATVGVLAGYRRLETESLGLRVVSYFLSVELEY